MSEQGPAEAWYEAVNAVASAIPDRPLPRCLIEIERGDWKLTLNNTDAPVQLQHGTDLSPLEILFESKSYLAIGILGPDGGMIGGIPEDAFIADMRAIVAETPHE